MLTKAPASYEADFLTLSLDFVYAVATDPHLSARDANALRIAVVLMKNCDARTGTVVKTHAEIAHEAHCSVSAVRRAIHVLASEGWLLIKMRDGKRLGRLANEYRPLIPLEGTLMQLRHMEKRAMKARDEYHANDNVQSAYVSKDRSGRR